MRLEPWPSSNGTKLLRRSVLVVAVTQFLLQALVIARGVPFIAINLTQDDSYYFLQTAWNLPRCGFVTFDGINPTNGVQPLWYWLLVLPALVVSNKATFLQVAVVLAAACNAACHWPILKISEHLGRPVAGLMMAASWMFVTTSTHRFLSLMETSVHGLAFWWWVLLLVRAAQNPTRWNRPFALACVTIVWARVDNALFAVIGFAFVVMRTLGSESCHATRRSLIHAIAIAVVGAALLLGSWWLMGGSVLPVSALIKMDDYHWSYRATAHGALSLLRVWPVVSLLVVVAAAALGAARRTLPTQLRNAYRPSFAALFAIVTLHLVYLGGHLPGYRWWYLTPYTVACCVLGGVAADAAVASVGRMKPMLVAAVLAPMVFLLIRAPMLGEDLRIPSLHHSRYLASLWIRANLPEGAVLASWNAGQLGYFADRPVINLDGLINSNWYRQHVLGDQAALAAYLDGHDVDYIVDHRSRKGSITRAQLVKSFPIEDDPKSRVVKVWRRGSTPTPAP